MTDLEPIKKANRERNALLVKKFTSAAPGQPYRSLTLDLADVLEEIARQWRERGSQLIEQRKQGAKGTDAKLQYAASELAGIAVSLRNDGLPDLYEATAKDVGPRVNPGIGAEAPTVPPPLGGVMTAMYPDVAEQIARDAAAVQAFVTGESDTLPALPDVCGIVEEISGATCAKGPHPIGTNHEGNGMIWPDRRNPLDGIEPEVSLNSRIFARGPRPDDATDPGLASAWDDMQPPPHVYVDGHSGMSCVYLFEINGVGEECGRPARHGAHGEAEPWAIGPFSAQDAALAATIAEGFSLPQGIVTGADPFSEPAKPSGYAPWKPEPKPRPFFPDASDFGPAPDHVSISQIQTAEACALQLRLQKRDGVAEQPWWANVAGTALHACFEKVERQRLDEYSELLVHVLSGEADACRELFTDALDQEIQATARDTGFLPEQWRVAKKGTEGEAWWREEGPRMLQDYVAWSSGMYADGWKLWTYDSGPALELPFRLDLGMGLPLEGRMDQVWHRIGDDGRLTFRIVDPKSGAHIPDRFQLGGYGHGLADLIRSMYGLVAGDNYDLEAAYYNARTGALEPTFSPLFELSREELAYRAGAVSGMHTAGIYPANPKAEYGGPCGICGVRYACPIMALKS